ncbi:TIGR02281 family clan AA aspartic protease [Motiliproteus coralliicola]|uniref:TIGR02281 family clan AA aspartic protease n=1 Tax=Motiliproteus coralliicola TaxID=2283196 RepID=A0A369WQS8_9GAMM|nr:TIGR02281 family clan AA aspartic protease [Motiliproteus coralliicola]RDE24448.1 TIGR02281 family clan AA aspartic protease [Motiliproteus coralliicola]
MLILFWLGLLALLTLGFDSWQQHLFNPNASPQSARVGNVVEVALKGNRQGHYLVSGAINGRPVTFLIDTGATYVAIPDELQQELGLTPGRAQRVVTANGTATAYETKLNSVSIGDIKVQEVRAALVPNMPGRQVLLGMSVLKEIEFVHRADTLTLRQYQ